MKTKIMLWIFLGLVALLCVGCSNGDTSGNNPQGNAQKPPPNVRVEMMPSATATFNPPAAADAALAPTSEPTSAQVYYIEPTPDEDAIANQISSMIDDITSKLRKQKLKP